MITLQRQTLPLCVVSSTKLALLSQSGFHLVRHWSITTNKVHHLAIDFFLSPGNLELLQSQNQKKHLGIWLRSLNWGSTNTQNKTKNPNPDNKPKQPHPEPQAAEALLTKKSQGDVCQEKCAAFSCHVLMRFPGGDLGWHEQRTDYTGAGPLCRVCTVVAAKLVQTVMQTAAVPYPPVSSWAWFSVLYTGLIRLISFWELSKYVYGTYRMHNYTTV